MASDPCTPKLPLYPEVLLPPPNKPAPKFPSKFLFGVAFLTLYFLETISLTIHSLLLVAEWSFHAASSTVTTYAQPFHNGDKCKKNYPAPKAQVPNLML